MKFTPLLIIAILFFSCNKKNQPTTYTIQAQDRYSGDGSAYANAVYSIEESTGSIIGPAYEEILTGTLDENGYATFDLKLENTNYLIDVVEPDNICHGAFNKQDLEIAGNNISFKYTACAYVKLVLNNEDCFDPETKIEYISYWGAGDENINTSGTHNGCTSSETDYRRLPEGANRYEWEVVKDGVTTSGSEEFTISKGDSLVFQIDY